ncbi:MAG TPA: hypothetical protein VJ797_03565 [Burkholderiales bacterium]|nr:hypothetical protein [Burkholderiales bacterium]
MYFLQVLLRDAVAAEAVEQPVGGIVVGVEQGGAGRAGADQRGSGAEQKLESFQDLQQLLVLVGDVGLPDARLNAPSGRINWGKP